MKSRRCCVDTGTQRDGQGIVRGIGGGVQSAATPRQFGLASFHYTMNVMEWNGMEMRSYVRALRAGSSADICLSAVCVSSNNNTSTIL